LHIASANQSQRAGFTGVLYEEKKYIDENHKLNLNKTNIIPIEKERRFSLDALIT